MGTPDSGDTGAFDELPELPSDVRIPDDASELAEESAQVRRELREERVGGARSPGRVFSVGGFRGSVPPSGGPSATEPASLRIPLLIMTAALLAAVVSLFAAAWPNDRRGATPAASASAAAPTSTARMVPALDLVDETGGAVPLASLLPAVLVVRGDCDCVEAIDAIAGATPTGVTVIAIGAAGGTAPATPAVPGASGFTVRRLRDPSGGLTVFFGSPATPSPAGGPVAPVALVARSGELAGLVDTGTPISAYAADLALLPDR